MTENTNVILESATTESNAAVEAFRQRMAALESQQAEYGNVDEGTMRQAIDEEKAKLANIELEIKNRYSAQLSQAIKEARQTSLNAGNITNTERLQADAFIAEMNALAAMHGTDDVINRLDAMADVMTDGQKHHIRNHFISQRLGGSDKNRFKDAFMQYTSATVVESDGLLQELDSLRNENAAMPVSNFKLASKYYQNGPRRVRELNVSPIAYEKNE